MSALPGGLLYIILALIEVLGGAPEFDADYLQAGLPVAVLELRQVPDPERDIYTLSARPFAAVPGSDVATPAAVLEEAVTYRIEESDLIATNYLVYPPGASVPGVAPLAPILAQLVGRTDRSAEIGGAPLLLDLSSDGDAEQPAGSLLVFNRRPYLIVSAPELDLILVLESLDE
jgi:hypothetical protein